MLSRRVLSLSFTIISSFTITSSVSAEEVARECRNYKGQLTQLSGKVNRYTKTCSAYESKVEKTANQINKIEEALDAQDLTKREIAKYSNKVKSLKRTLQNQRRHATRYCDTLNDLQEKYAQYEERCKPDGSDNQNTPGTVTKVITPLECDSNGYKKICTKVVLENDKCFQQYENTYYFQEYFSSDFAEYTREEFTILFPTSVQTGQVGLLWKIVAKQTIDPRNCVAKSPN